MSRKALLIMAGALAVTGAAAAIAHVGYRSGRVHGAAMFGEGGGFDGGGRAAGRMLRQLDANKDGAVTIEEMLAARDPMFARWDTNNDGAIDGNEIAAKVRERAEYWSKRLVRRFDQNKDGRISREEFQRPGRERFAMRDLNDDGTISEDELPPGARGREGRFGRWMRGEGRDGERAGPPTLERLLGRLDARFKRFDTNGDGVIDAGEIDAAVGQHAEYWTKRFLKRFDQNRDGRVTKEEFNRFAKERFAMFDVDDDGKITEADLPPALRGRGALR